MNESFFASQIKENSIALFTFLKEFSELRSAPIRTIAQYEQLLWLNDIPVEQECSCVLWSDEYSIQSGTWVEIFKPDIQPAPVPSNEIIEWIKDNEIENSSLDLPHLCEYILVANSLEETDDELFEPEEQRKYLKDYPDIVRVWEEYIEGQWQPWAEQNRKHRKVQKVYTDLFTIFQRQQRLGEQFEVVVGIGMLSWNFAGKEIYRHLLACPSSLQFDPVKGVISLAPTNESNRFVLEQDMVDPRVRPPLNLQNNIEAMIADCEEDFWPGNTFEKVLSAWVHGASADGQYSDSLCPPKPQDNIPTIHLAPAVILRKRDEGNYVKMFEEIIVQVNQADVLPTSLQMFVAKNIDSYSNSYEERSLSVGEIYFPLEYNDEQKAIVEKLEKNQGVLVQGPPGTGKSHTIVNLICHLLANGQRVLVTSHTDRSLKVLKHFIQERVPDIAQLAVVLLGTGNDSLQAMEESVLGITQQHSNWNEQKVRQTIENYAYKLDEARRTKSRIDSDLRSIRESETFEHAQKFERYSGTLTKIAARLHDESEMFGWFKDEPDININVPLNEIELKSLCDLLQDSLVSEANGWTWQSIDIETIPQPPVVAQLIRDYTDAKSLFEKNSDCNTHPMFHSLLTLSTDERLRLITDVRKFAKTSERVINSVYAWTESAFREIIGGRDHTWKILLESTKKQLSELTANTQWVDEITVTGIDERGLDVIKADAEDLLQYLDEGKRWGFGPFQSGIVKRTSYLRDKVRLGGRLCDNPLVLRNLVKWLTLKHQLTILQQDWKAFGVTAQGSFVAQVEDVRSYFLMLEGIFGLSKELTQVIQHVEALDISPEPLWFNLSEVRQFVKITEASQAKHEYESKDAALTAIRAVFDQISSRGDIDPIIGDLIEAVLASDSKMYADVWEDARSRSELLKKAKHRRQLLLQLSESAPQFVQSLTSNYDPVMWEQRLIEFPLAWNWACAKGWVAKMCDPHYEQQKRIELDDVNRTIRHCLGKISALKAWQSCMTRMTEHERQHLTAWSKAMRNMGKGTGKYAAVHRRAAREHMKECRTAIPAWIMPLYRVAQNIQPGTDMFDVVIVDEASQSGPEAILLTYLAKKIVVVGDDKQISPEYVGLNREDVNQLRQRHISKLQHNDQYGVDSSFFDLADIYYPGRIRLREHFRCMPEIIQFCNDLSYQDEPLIPLKQYGASRLLPVIETIHVTDGYNKGIDSRIINPPEVEVIVTRIVACCRDPRYAGKTFGVISLQGNFQAREIERSLIEKLGPEEIESRHLVCGDAYDFQGDERDVIFLSLVAATTSDGAHPRRIGTLTGARPTRRFNVAISRAKEQLILVYSATLNDLSPSCLRHRLLKYCLNPQLAQTEIAGMAINELRYKATTAERSRLKPPHPFDSWFELDVFLRINAQGYRVIPQYEVAGYYIDLVIEGTNRRLAVECDGEFWHGPDRYEHDMARQRMLERCGWQFWRIRESAFALDPNSAMQPLWDTLNRLGI